MLDKNKTDKRLKKYIKEHLSKGYTKRAVKQVLSEHGYNERYIDGLLKKHSELQFVRLYSIFAPLLFAILFFAYSLLHINNQPQQITGYAVSIGTGNEGCCISVCHQTARNECYGKFIDGKKCSELDECSVGCCIDKEGYCLTNYLKGNCIGSYGLSINRDCSDVIFCRNLTGKSYAAGQYGIRNKKGAGASMQKPESDYYTSSFKIQYYLYDKANVLRVLANIKENGTLVDSITLYDDGSHNDGAGNDGIYGNNWLSSRINKFEGFKKLDIDINIEYSDGSHESVPKAQSITVLGSNKCLPIYNRWDNSPEKYSIILAAGNYEALNDGYQKFQADAQNFLNALFSIERFKSIRDDFNIYRLDNSLSYFNIPTLTRVVSGSCPYYSSKKDLLVLLDNNEQYCVAESPGIVRVNPQLFLYPNITNSAINNTFADLCSYVLTMKKLADDAIGFATPPKIAVNTLNNMTYSTSIINLSFTVSAMNYPANNSVFLENKPVFNEIIESESAASIELTLANGTNAVLIRSVDKNKNKAFAQILLNVSLQ